MAVTTGFEWDKKMRGAKQLELIGWRDLSRAYEEIIDVSMQLHKYTLEDIEMDDEQLRMNDEIGIKIDMAEVALKEIDGLVQSTVSLQREQGMIE